MAVCAAASGARSRNSKKNAPMRSMTEADMRQAVYSLFAESQHHISSHRKNVHQLRQVHLEWCNGKDALAAEREEAFFLTFIQCLNVVLAVKKNEEVVGRMMRFMIGFCLDEEEGSSVTARFIENLMLYALEGIDAKEKPVRTRLCQLLVACVNSVDELSDGVWEAFRGKMIERLFDKEAAVRVHAVHAMARLQALPIGEDEGGLDVLDIFIDLLQHDPSYEVRKTVLAQIDVLPKSLPAVLGRRRDVDARLRKAFYTSKLAEIDMRTLSVEQRDAVLRSGLTDRDAGVKQACINMIFRSWIHDTNSNLVEFLACLDVISNTEMAVGALECFFDGHPEVFAGREQPFGPAYMENLTVETAFILRVYAQWKSGKEGAEAVHEMLPEAIQMAAYIRRAYETLLTSDEAPGEVEFIMQELLLVSKHLDSSDEVGRRVLVDALLELLTNLELGDSLFSQALHLLVQKCGQTEYWEIASGLVEDFRAVFESSDDLEKGISELSLASPTRIDEGLSEEVRILAQLRCLELIREALSLASTLEEDSFLAPALLDVVIPAVNSAYSAVQTAGLLCLGLACTLSRDLAQEYMGLLLDFFRLGSEETALTALRIAFDLLFLFGIPPASSDEYLEALTAALYDPRGQVQAVAAEGFAKLFLHNMLSDLGILEGLLQLAYHPATANEPRLRQCLAYFFPAYAFSRPDHQMALARVAVPFLKTYQSGAGLSLGEVSAQLAHYTDPESLLAGQSHGEGAGPHDLLATDCIWQIIEAPTSTAALSKCLTSLLSSRIRFTALAKSTIKKLVFLSAQASKLVVQDRLLLPAVKKILTQLVELDDVETVLEPEELARIKERLAPHLPQSESFSIPSAMARAKSRIKTVSDEPSSVDSPLDNLDDILK